MKDDKVLRWVLALTLFSVIGIAILVEYVLKEYRIYDKDAVAEIEWRKKTQHNLNRPREKKINL